jgi:8-oxo-dGTP pyrophosphatase MutT (NUDIX family)
MFAHAGVILIDKKFEKVLLVQGKKFFDKNTGYTFPDGIYSFPKGKKNMCENYQDCASRELFEETGIKINLSNKDPFIILNDAIYFIKIVSPNEFKYKHRNLKEISHILWMPINQLAKNNCNRAIRKFIGLDKSKILSVQN